MDAKKARDRPSESGMQGANGRQREQSKETQPMSFISQRLDNMMRFSGLPLVLFCVGLNVWVVHTYITTAYPVINRVSHDHISIPVLHSSITAVIVANIWFNYAACVFIDAGEAPEPNAEPHSSHRFRRCTKCLRWKDARTHHCSVCRRCVRRMDHHCMSEVALLSRVCPHFTSVYRHQNPHRIRAFPSDRTLL